MIHALYFEPTREIAQLRAKLASEQSKAFKALAMRCSRPEPLTPGEAACRTRGSPHDAVSVLHCWRCAVIITVRDGESELPAHLSAELLKLSPSDVVERMRQGAITGVVEKGAGADIGRTRVTHFSGSVRSRIVVSETGEVVQTPSVDFGDLALRRWRQPKGRGCP